MAQKRMFSLQVVDTDKFLDLPVSAQALYFHLGMHGDDDGFVASPRKIIRAVGSSEDDLNHLADNGYIIPFESGVVVIADWNINNTLKNDRYHATVYGAEKARLNIDNQGRYLSGTTSESNRNHPGTELEPEHNVTKPNVLEHNETKYNENDKKCDVAQKEIVRADFEKLRQQKIAEFSKYRGPGGVQT